MKYVALDEDKRVGEVELIHALGIAREVAEESDERARLTIIALVGWIEGVTGLDGKGEGII